MSMVRQHTAGAGSVLGQVCRAACLLSLWVAGGEAIYAHTNPGEPPEYCTLFNHMVKSGGSTIKDKLEESSMADGVEPPAMCLNGFGNEQTCLDAMNNSPVIAGYAELLRYPLQGIGRACEYFTVMRHPIDRLVSAFFYCPENDPQDRPDKWCGYVEDPQPVTERLRDFAEQNWKNKAFRQMTFGLYCPPMAFCEQAKPGAQQAVHEPGGWDLLQQVEAILGSYTAVGILEHWDLSMQLFDARVRSPVRDWQNIKKSNPGRLSGLRDQVYQWAHMSPEIHRIMATDMLLYDYALSVFKLQTAATLGTNTSMVRPHTAGAGSLLRQACRAACLLSLGVVGGEALYAHTTPGEPPEYCTLFNHMVKSGGSTIKDKLKASARADRVAPPGMCLNGYGREQTCVDAMNSSAVIAGYAELLRYPLEGIGRECEYFTVMRHPIDRLVSAFFYCPENDPQHRPAKWCGYVDDPQPVTERLRDFAEQNWKNKAFRQMTFGLYCPPMAFCEQAKPGAQQAVHEPGGWDLLQQVEAILGSYTAVGILEHWDLSMQLFDARVRSPVRDWQNIKKSNPGRLSGLRDEVYQWAQLNPDIHRIMATDMLLYDYALSVFKLQTVTTLGTVWAN
eukprot:g3050.t1